jgi:drug/metabolite transporter (DMT)-like permease
MIGSETQAHPLRGVLLIMAAVLVFACMDAATKHMATRYNVPMVVAIRYIVNLGLLAALLGPRLGRGLYFTQRTGLVIARAGCLAISSLCAGLALRLMPVAETTAIIYLSPFGVLLLAGPLLGEKVGWQRWLAAAAGFCGVLLIGRPGSGLDPLGIVYASITAAFTVGYFLLSRILAKTETTHAMLFHVALLGAVFFGAMLPWNWNGPPFEALDIALLAAMGAMALLGHYLFTAAYRYASASLLAPVNYMHLVWAGGLGWLVFDHVPDAVSMAGLALVAAAGSGIALWTHFSRQGQKPAIIAEDPLEV